jgi:hypothetical protein
VNCIATRTKKEEREREHIYKLCIYLNDQIDIFVVCQPFSETVHVLMEDLLMSLEREGTRQGSLQLSLTVTLQLIGVYMQVLRWPR